MLVKYAPIVVLLVIAWLAGLVGLGLGRFLGASKPSNDKLSPYECGFAPIEQDFGPVSVPYYLIAILFVIFDVETVFLIPWAVSCKNLGMMGMQVIGFFAGMLVLGLWYEWIKGGLQWD